jgi:Zn-dependent protease with chaperone function
VTNVAILAVLNMSGADDSSLVGAGGSPPWALFAAVGIGVVGLIFGASGVKMLSLRKGGGAVAEMLGGRQILDPTDDPDERRLLNVVQEMAIASGTPVPVVYVLDSEPGINAFASGHGTEDAAVAVTRGAMEQFTRDELQGVVAHEFSHILNRDVRLNTRLTGLLFGILVLSIAGRLLLRGGAHARIGRSSNKGGGAGAAVAIGLVLMIVGYIGVFFGRLIKQSVSRQREFLADASAVQFTRNPDGLASALKKIRTWSDGAVVNSPAAEEISHFFFADGMKPSVFGRLLSSHPPLDERIRRLDPSYVAASSGEAAPGFSDDSALAGLVAAAAPGTGRVRGTGLEPSDRVDTKPSNVVASVGTTQPEKFVYDDLIEIEIPGDVKAHLSSTFGAVAVLFAMLLDADATRRRTQIDLLRSTMQPAMLDEITTVFPAIDGIDRFARLPVLDLAMPMLRSMSMAQFKQLAVSMEAVIDADDHLSLHEYAIRTIVQYRLDQHFGIHRSRHKGSAQTGNVADDVAMVLSGLARLGHGTETEVAEAYNHARGRLTGVMTLPDRASSPSAVQIDQAVTRLSLLALRRKEAIVDACAHSVLADADVTLEEAELLRVVVVSLGCPLPPFLPTLVAA